MAHILLAEDDDSMRHFLARALERAGHEVTCAREGIEALGLFEHHLFDLLLADVVMPGLDGIELARRATKLQPRMRVVFITGFAAVALRTRRGYQGAKVLSKPFHLRDLVEQINLVLGTDASLLA